MYKNIRICCCVVVGFASLSMLHVKGQQETPNSQLRVAVVPDSRYEDSVNGTSMYLDSTFYVVIENDGDDQIKIWKEWCSWGYYSFSLELTDSKGNIYKIKRGVKSWTKNYPEAYVIPADGCYVWPIDLKHGNWVGVPWSQIKNHDEWTIQVAFDIDHDDEAQKTGVWTGVCSSDKLQFKAYVRH